MNYISGDLSGQKEAEGTWRQGAEGDGGSLPVPQFSLPSMGSRGDGSRALIVAGR